MSFLVVNCFHWIGYHLTNKLLENGYEVDGLDTITSYKKDHLSMFFMRNHLFSHIDKREELKNKYDMALFIGDSVVLNTSDIIAGRIIRIHHEQTNHKVKRNVVNIKHPPLYGEWMPMSENGMLLANDHIQFTSEFFQNEAVYVEDFMQWLFQTITVPKLTHQLIIKSANSKERTKKLENTVHLRENSPKEETLQKVLDHFHKFADYYHIT